MATKILRSINDVIDDRPTNSQLRLATNMFWGYGVDGPPEVVRSPRQAGMLYEMYNPGVRRALDATKDPAREGITMIQLEQLLEAVKYTQIKHFFETRRLKPKRGKLGITAVNHAIAEFMGPIERWKTVEQLANELCVSNATIANNCLGPKAIDCIHNLKRYWITPLGENELLGRLWSKENRIMHQGTWYYSITFTAREAQTELEGMVSPDSEKMIKRVAHLVNTFPSEFNQINYQGRTYLSPVAKHVLTDLVTQKEVTGYLGISPYMVRTLASKGEIKRIPIGSSNWYSGHSVKQYKEGHLIEKPMLVTAEVEPYTARDFLNMVYNLTMGESPVGPEAYQIVQHVRELIGKRLEGGVVGTGDLTEALQRIDDPVGLEILKTAHAGLRDFSPASVSGVLMLRTLSEKIYIALRPGEGGQRITYDDMNEE